jgi:hypothetical protein
VGGAAVVICSAMEIYFLFVHGEELIVRCEEEDIAVVVILVIELHVVIR